MPGVAERVRRKDLEGTRQYRIIPSRFPPINIFEHLVEPDELEVLYALEASTNDRLRAQAGDLYRLPKAQWVTGPGASVVMAAFTHIGRESRFSDGSYGVYYAAMDKDTAIRETAFHTERFLAQTQEPPIEIDQRCYIGRMQGALHDIRGRRFQHLHQPALATWPQCQAFAAERRIADSPGLYYRSVRRPGGQCVAAFSPLALTLPVQGPHFRYCWNGTRIEDVLTITRIRRLHSA